LRASATTIHSSHGPLEGTGLGFVTSIPDLWRWTELRSSSMGKIVLLPSVYF
jgi:hypothetical protein